MKIFKFNKEIGQEVRNFNSDLAFYSKLMKTEETTNIGFMYIEKGGVVGFHKAPVPQLFIIVQGEGWIEGEDRKKIILKSGDGVFWGKGEGHASGSEVGLTAVVIQSNNLEYPLL